MSSHVAADTEMVLAVCKRCHRTRGIPVLVLDGRSVPMRPAPLCDICRAEHEVEQREVAEKQERERRLAERAKHAGQTLDRLHEAGVNVREHGHAMLDSYDTSESGAGPVAAAREFMRDVRTAGKYDPVRGLYLCGDTGTGKSHLAVAVARDLLLDPEWGGTVVYDHALRLIGRIQRTYSMSNESADAVLDKRINAGLWILDDLGTEAPSADVVRRLTEIITERAMRPTIITSNLRPDQLEGRHSEFYRIVSRLGPGYFRTVLVEGRDRRFDVEP